MIFAVEMLPNVITSHYKFQLNHAKRFQDMNLQKLAEFIFFQGVKIVIKHKTIVQSLYTERRDKVTNLVAIP